MACNDNISNLCSDPILTSCVDHEGDLGKNTKIEKDCVTQKDVNEDLYSISDDIIENINVSTITSTCIDIPQGASISEIVSLYESKICELNTKIEILESVNYANIDITNFGLTFPECIADSCENPPTTLAEWMQVMMDQRNCT